MKIPPIHAGIKHQFQIGNENINNMKTIKKEPVLVDIAELVIRNYGVDIRKSVRGDEMMRARWLYTKLCVSFTKFSLAAIGGEIGKDHSTISHYCKSKLNNIHCFTEDLEFLFKEYAEELLELRPELTKKLILKSTKDLLYSYNRKLEKTKNKVEFYKKKFKNEAYARENLEKELSLEKTKTAELRAELASVRKALTKCIIKQ